MARLLDSAHLWRILPIALVLVASSVARTQSTTPPVDDLASQLQQAHDELANLEDQISREQDRLTRLETELTDLRRQQAIISSAESAFRLGEELYTAGSIVWARDAFQAVITNFPESQYYPDALFRLELISFELQDYDMALQYYTTLSTVYPGFAQLDLARLAAALSYYNSGRFADSRQVLALVAPEGSYGPLAEYLTAVAFVEEGDMDSAKASLESILNRSRSRREEAALADRARIALAQIYVDEGDYQQAHDLYDRISPFSPYYDVGMLGKVWAYMREEKYQDAYNLAERVIEEVPGSQLRPEFELAMANCALGAEDLDVAIARYQSLLEQNRGTSDLSSMILGDSTSATSQYEDQRERLERMRVGLAQMKEEAYASGNLDLVRVIEDEEASLRQMFVQISSMETQVSLPTGGSDTGEMSRQLSQMISQSRSATDALAFSAQEVSRIADERGTQSDRDELASLEAEIQRIRLSLQDLASKFESGMTEQHDWVQETQYGIAIANYMERELMRDSLSYYGSYFQDQIQSAYAAGDSAHAQGLIQQRQSQTSALQGRIRRAAETCAGLFEDYLANFPESRFSADVLVRLAQLYYDIDNATYLDRIATAGFDSTSTGYVLEDYSRSIELYNRVLTNYPGSEVEDVALYSLGYCQDKMGDPQGAVASYRRLLREHPQSLLAPETEIRAGDFYFDSFQFDSARVFYEKILQYPAADPDIFQLGVYKLGWTYYLLNDYLRSAATFAYLIQDSDLMDSLGIPRRGGAMTNEAIEYIAHDFMEQPSLPSVSLATRFLDSFDQDSVSYRVLNQMGDFYEEQGYWADAIDAYAALLQRFPGSPQAPFIQVKIASAYEGAGNLELATQAREQLVEQYGAGSSWASEYGTTQTATVVDSIRAVSLEQTIAYYHAQAVENRDDLTLSRQDYEALADRIGTYLHDYPQSKQNYDFRFFLGDAYYALGRFVDAGDAYMAVALDSSSAARQEDACINACGSFFTAYAQQPGIDSALVRQKQIDATNLYMSRFPNGQYVDQFLFAAAGNAYNASDYEAARTEYMTLYNNYPSSQYVARSARFVAAAYEAQEMFSQAEEWYGKAADASARTGEDLGENFDLLAAQAAYRDASALAESQDVQTLIEAAHRYEESANSHPESAVAPNALYDAAETYAKAGAIDDAMRVFDDLARRYPQSELAPQGLLRSAFIARDTGRFIDAGNIYLAAFRQFPTAPDMGTALYSAAVSYEDGQRMDLAIQVYDQIIATRAAGPEVMVLVYGKYGEYLYQHYDYTRAKQMFSDCLTVYDQYRQGDAYYPGMSAFYLGEMAFKDYQAVTATVETAQTKTQLMQATEAWYGKALTYFSDVWFMAACVRAGELYEDYANAIGYMEPPAGLDEAGIQAFYDQLYPVMETYLQKALEVYQTAVEKAISSGITNDWVYKAADHLELMAPGTVNSLGVLPGWSGNAPSTPPSGSTQTTPQATGQPQAGAVESPSTPPDTGQGTAGGGN